MTVWTAPADEHAKIPAASRVDKQTSQPRLAPSTSSRKLGEIQSKPDVKRRRQSVTAVDNLNRVGMISQLTDTGGGSMPNSTPAPRP
jgi:hypothetical protein